MGQTNPPARPSHTGALLGVLAGAALGPLVPLLFYRGEAPLDATWYLAAAAAGAAIGSRAGAQATRSHISFYWLHLVLVFAGLCTFPWWYNPRTERYDLPINAYVYAPSREVAETAFAPHLLVSMLAAAVLTPLHRRLLRDAAARNKGNPPAPAAEEAPPTV